MLTEYMATGTEEAKKKRWKPGIQIMGGLDILASPSISFGRKLSQYIYNMYMTV